MTTDDYEPSSEGSPQLRESQWHLFQPNWPSDPGYGQHPS